MVTKPLGALNVQVTRASRLYGRLPILLVSQPHVLLKVQVYFVQVHQEVL